MIIWWYVYFVILCLGSKWIYVFLDWYDTHYLGLIILELIMSRECNLWVELFVLFDSIWWLNLDVFMAFVDRYLWLEVSIYVYVYLGWLLCKIVELNMFEWVYWLESGLGGLMCMPRLMILLRRPSQYQRYKRWWMEISSLTVWGRVAVIRGICWGWSAVLIWSGFCLSRL